MYPPWRRLSTQQYLCSRLVKLTGKSIHPFLHPPSSSRLLLWSGLSGLCWLRRPSLRGPQLSHRGYCCALRKSSPTNFRLRRLSRQADWRCYMPMRCSIHLSRSTCIRCWCYCRVSDTPDWTRRLSNSGFVQTRRTDIQRCRFPRLPRQQKAFSRR